MSEVNLSKVLSRKAGCSEKWRKRICSALEMTEQEVIQRGSEEPAVFFGNPKSTTPTPLPLSTETKGVTDIKQEALSAVAALRKIFCDVEVLGHFSGCPTRLL